MTGQRAPAPTSLRRLATEGSVEWHAAVTSDARPCLLVRAQEADALAGAVRAHSAVVVDECPTVLAHDLAAESPWMALDCDPMGTLEDLALRWPKRSLPYSQAIVVTHTLARVLSAAHAKGELLGAIAASQVIVDRDGALRVLGLGFGESAWGPRTFRAPSVALGEPPTKVSDVSSVLALIRAHTQWVTGVPTPLVRILQGEPGPLERAFARGLFGAFNQTLRLDGQTGLRTLERFWRFVGVWPDHEGFARRARSTFDEARVRLTVARDFSWFSVDDGPRHDLVRREPVRRVLRALLSAGGSPVSVEELVRSAWPGEALVGSSGADRLYVALSTLRKLDLRAAIVRERGGYALCASTSYRDP